MYRPNTVDMPTIPDADPAQDHTGRAIVYVPTRNGITKSNYDQANLPGVLFLEQIGIVRANDIKRTHAEPAIACYLPEGWTTAVLRTREPLVHSIVWDKPYDGKSNDDEYVVLDPQGRPRLLCGHKYSFVSTMDWVVYVYVMPRFRVETAYDFENKLSKAWMTDAGRRTDELPSYEVSFAGDTSFDAALVAARTDAESWLSEHYPNWQDATAHWED
jgi:hypothetical protein